MKERFVDDGNFAEKREKEKEVSSLHFTGRTFERACVCAPTTSTEILTLNIQSLPSHWHTAHGVSIANVFSSFMSASIVQSLLDKIIIIREKRSRRSILISTVRARASAVRYFERPLLILHHDSLMDRTHNAYKCLHSYK